MSAALVVVRGLQKKIPLSIPLSHSTRLQQAGLDWERQWFRRVGGCISFSFKLDMQLLEPRCLNLFRLFCC